jgi:iron(III) transport system permease protein
LWVAAVAILIPIALPVGALVVRVAGATDDVRSILFDTRTFELVVRSALLATLVTASAIVIGVSTAWITVRTNIRGRSIWGVLIALPLVIPSYVIALSYISASGPRGLFAQITGSALPVLDGLPGAWLALTISTFPYVFLIVAASLRRIDPTLEDAARGLGASPLRVFRTVTLPQLRPAIGAGALLVALYTLSDFGAVSLMRFDAFTRVIYAQYAGRLDRTPAAVLSLALILIALAFIWGEERTRGSGTYFSHRPNRTAVPRHLSPTGRFAATFALGVVVIAGVVLPVAVLVSWVAEGSGSGAGVIVDWAAVGGSLLGSTLAAILAMTAAVPIAVLAVRYRSRMSGWLERSVFVAFSLPHITVAIAVVFFSVRYLGPFYQSLAVLVVVYAAVFLAQATGSAKASMLQVDPAVEEASRGLGHGPWATMRRITVPLIRPGLLAGGALVFLTTMKELPATLLLRPTGFETLAVDIWSAANELLYAEAATSALVLLAISVVPMYFLVLRQKDVAV